MIIQRFFSKFKLLANDKRIRKAMRLAEACSYFDWRIWSLEVGNITIKEALLSGKPQAIGKLGSGELQAIRAYLRFCHKSDWQDATNIYRHQLYTNAGVFPEQPHIFQRYCEYMLNEILPEITVMGVWHNFGEARIVRKYSHSAALVPTRSLETYYIQRNHWTSVLKGKTVLVMHPFFDSIKNQFRIREKIWPGKEYILPDFSLVQIKVPQLPLLVTPEHSDWFSSLEGMKQKMALIDFDVAFIGAGAYSLPLAVYAKKLGKQGIHLGGATQVYFGIRGRRFDSNPDVSPFFNEHWIRPLPQDTPGKKDNIENGCYW